MVGSINPSAINCLTHLSIPRPRAARAFHRNILDELVHSPPKTILMPRGPARTRDESRWLVVGRTTPALRAIGHGRRDVRLAFATPMVIAYSRTAVYLGERSGGKAAKPFPAW